MTDFKRDQRIAKHKRGDPYWVAWHFFPKWFYGLTLIAGLLIGLQIASWWEVDWYKAFVITGSIAVGTLIATDVLDRALLRRRRSAALAVRETFEFNSSESVDLPVSFGYKTAWIAVPSKDGRAVAECLRLKHIKSCSWKLGITLAYDLQGVFVTPPIEEWTIAVGSLPSAEQDHFLPTLMAISQRFTHVFYFGTHRIVGYQAWAVAQNGQVRRAHCWLGESGEFLLDIGDRTPEEVNIGTGIKDDENPPDEKTVLELASRWVLDPRKLEQHTEARGPGLFGTR